MCVNRSTSGAIGSITQAVWSMCNGRGPGAGG